MATTTSYLQTLAKDEAIAFVASLQKVKDHLSQELQWMSEQVQQKTAQLQGIETLLSEALTLGLVTTETDSFPEDENVVEFAAAESGSPATGEAAEPIAAIAAPVRPTSTQQRGKQGKAKPAKTPSRSKPSAATQTGTAEARSKLAAPPSKPNQQGKSNLQRFLKPQWHSKALTEAVGEVLNHASVPLSTDELMAELYDGLSKEDYNRAKNSLANILSVGRSKGTWKSTGRGRYAGNAVGTV
ncbi:MAG: hypothetical protein RBJ76_23000 [Stenomitos frigidus ULC029]